MPVDRLAVLTRQAHTMRDAARLTGSDAVQMSRAAGRPLKAAALPAAVAAFGPTLQPFRTGRGARKVRARIYDTFTTGDRFTVVLELKPGGVWVFGEVGARPHVIGGRRRRVAGPVLPGTGPRFRTSGGRPALGMGSAPGGARGARPHPVKFAVVHPGTTGRGTIRYAHKLVRRVQNQVIGDAFGDVIRQAWRRG
jgi:hypothetical protein